MLYDNPNCIYKNVGNGDIRIVFHKATKAIWIELIQFDQRGYLGAVASANVQMDEVEKAFDEIRKVMVLA